MKEDGARRHTRELSMERLRSALLKKTYQLQRRQKEVEALQVDVRFIKMQLSNYKNTTEENKEQRESRRRASVDISKEEKRRMTNQEENNQHKEAKRRKIVSSSTTCGQDSAQRAAGVPGVIHKSPSSRGEEGGEKTFVEELKIRQQKLKIKFKVPPQEPQTKNPGESSHMSEALGRKIPRRKPPNVAKIPQGPTLDDLPIMNRPDFEKNFRLSEDNFRTVLSLLFKRKESDEVSAYCVVNRQQQYGVKAVCTPGSSPIDVYNFFQYGILDRLHLSPNLAELQHFSQQFKAAVSAFNDSFARGRGVFLKFYSSYPEFKAAGKVVGSKHIVHMKISNGLFPKMEEPPEEKVYTQEQVQNVIAEQLSGIFMQTQEIHTTSRLRINHKGPNIIIASYQKKEIKDRDLAKVTSFEEPFKTLSGSTMEYSDKVLQLLCRKIRRHEDHLCRYCARLKEPAV